VPPPYRQPHWEKFVGIPYTPQGAVGCAPSSWVRNLGLTGVPNAGRLPTTPLTRQQVRRICTDPKIPVLFGYVCVMAWGRQDKVCKGRQNVLNAWGANRQVNSHLQTLRSGGLTRIQAYRLFLGSGKIPGLGPSFFTKLLYFFSQSIPKGEDPYIMDNVILRAVALLTGNPFQCHATPGGYQACCEEIDAVATILGCSGQVAEERLFSSRGKTGLWRSYVNRNKSNLPQCDGRRAYRNTMHNAYPHISTNDF